MVKLSDYIFAQLKEWGARHVFLVTGGGAMHLNDSIGTSGLGYICTHHEQAAAMAAEGYARITNHPSVLNTTTGPGSINALNGVFGAFTDSIPMLIISGQVKRANCKKYIADMGKAVYTTSHFNIAAQHDGVHHFGCCGIHHLHLPEIIGIVDPDHFFESLPALPVVVKEIL